MTFQYQGAHLDFVIPFSRHYSPLKETELLRETTASKTERGKHKMSIKHLEMGKIFLVQKNMMVEYLKDTGVNSNDLPKVKSEKKLEQNK